MAEKKETIILDFEVDSADAVVSIENLTKANAALRAERKKVDLSTEEGIKRVKDINKALDQNNETIKNNSSTLEKNRLNVGNYTESIKAAVPALDKFTGGLYSSAKGFVDMAKGALAFIATPIGAVIAAIGLAIGALTAYFKGSEEGQDKLAKVMAVGKVVWEGFMVAVEKVGEVIFAVGEAIFSAGDKLLSFFSKSAGGAVDAVVKTANRISDLQDKIESDDNKFTVKRAEVNKKVARLREDAIKLEGAAKKRVIEEAIALEQGLADEEAKHAQDKLDLITLEIAASGNATEEQKKQRADATADVINKLAQSSEATLKFQKQLESLNEAEIKAQQKAADEKKKAEAEKQLAFETTFNKEQDAILKAEVLRAEAHVKELKRIEAEKEAQEKKVTAAMDGLVKHGDAITAAADKAREQAIIDDEAAKKRRDDAINLASETANGITNVIMGFYKVKENQLAVNLANEKTALQTQYASDVAELEEKFKKGEISKEQYDKDILGLNATYQASVKTAEIEQAKALNTIKEKEFKANKANQLIQAGVDMAQAILSVFALTKGGPIIKGIAAVAAGVFAAAQIAIIAASKFVPTTFRTGGYTGDGNPDELAGSVHKSEFVMPASVVSRYGKDHFQSYMDGSIVANGSTQNMASQASMSQAPVYLNYTEFKRFMNEVQLKESIVSA